MHLRSRFWLTRMLALLPILAVASTGRAATEEKATMSDQTPTSATTTTGAAAATTPHDGARDFDFIFGRWKVHNRRLVDRLVGSHEWKEFEATVEGGPCLDGRGNVDEYRTDFWPGFVGMTVRVFDPKAHQWAIYWADNRSGVLDSGVFGSFDGDVGTFGGKDVLRGRTVLTRYTWRRGAAPHWEQAFSGDGGVTWETNWTMDMTRIP
ncbi:MAG TPA: hypothetical protein VGV61_02585 [Thermoanaerobaculia bacterium]|jgi:hypothetical protein|nr:hypothetical protein [Thermoanaerobaculia bacterium]